MEHAQKGLSTNRAFILLLDSFGIGASLDAASFGDEGANTFGHIAQACAEGHADQAGLRAGPLYLPHLNELGLGLAGLASCGQVIPGFIHPHTLKGAYGYGVETSHGKDTPSGHWEIAGLPVRYDWGYFPNSEPCFPDTLITQLIAQAHLPGVLGNKHASGTVIIDELGEAHLRTQKPIVYTSADSVFQIAAHEDAFGLERLYEVCRIARKLVDSYQIGRVIARPFKGEPGHFFRTGNRKDLATPPHAPTLLDKLVEAHHAVIAVGKVADIFAHRGISTIIKADGNDALFDATLKAMDTAPEGSLTFTNFVDFDSSYGHRRNVAGYAHALEKFDAQLPQFIKKMHPGDLAIITADHGCDPTWPGSDHTREHIPILAFGPSVSPRFIGRRDTFADIGQTLAAHLGIDALDHGVAF
ncbi:MAG: phosphopentomutase [Gammaproteobacteria bacterium]|nr:phosphopentomutase [Gammaproteobacteria bacterium]